MPPNGAVPVEALLKLSLDKAGAQSIQDFLDKQESSFSRIEQYAGKISGHFEGLTRGALGVAGIAGVGAILNQFMQVTQSGALVGLAAGRVTGGIGVGHNYGQAMLAAQARTGVNSSQIAEGLVQAVQAVGGNPTPQQAAVLGGLIAGYGQSVGLTPSQVSAVVSPILQASNKPLTQGNILGTGAMLSQGLTAFPGSQAAPMLGLISQLATQQAIGVGPSGGFTPDVHGLVAAINAGAQTNSIFRNPQVTAQAVGGISSGLQNAYGNPAMEAFLQMAGIGYYQQRKGFTPQNVQAIMAQSTKLYGTGVTRDLALRSMFGLTGADYLEQFQPGSLGSSLLQKDLSAHIFPDMHKLQQQLHNLQLSHTPQADVSKFSAQALRWLFSSPLHAALALGGATLAPGAIKGAAKLLGRGAAKAGGAAWRGLRGGGGGAGDAATGDTYGADSGDGWFTGAADGAGAGAIDSGASSIWGALRGIGLDVGGALGGATLGALLFPPSGEGDWPVKGVEQNAVRNVLRMGLAQFGAKGIHTAKARLWMRNQLIAANNVGPGGTAGAARVWGQAALDVAGNRPILPSMTQGALGMLDQALGGGKTASGKDPIDAFTQGASDLEKAAKGLLQFLQGPKSGFTAYTPGSMLGTPAVQALGAGSPGLEYASLVGGSGGSALAAAFSGGGSRSFVSTSTSAASGSQSTGGGGWQTAVASWYDPGAGGTNGSYGGGAWSGHPVEPGTWGFAHKTMTFGTKVQFEYQGKSTTATCVDRGPYVAGRDFDLLPGPARAIGMTGAGVVTLKWRVVSTGSGSSSGASSGGGSGTVHVAGDAGGGGGGAGGGASGSGGGVMDGPMQGAGASSGGADPQAASRHAHASHLAQTLRAAHHHHHVKVVVDGRETRVHRILTGHYHT